MFSRNFLKQTNKQTRKERRRSNNVVQKSENIFNIIFTYYIVSPKNATNALCVTHNSITNPASSISIIVASFTNNELQSVPQWQGNPTNVWSN